MTFTWITVAMVALAGFFGAGTYSLLREKHRVAAGIVGALALACLAVGVVSVLPGPAQ
jgi:hypothetical protein